MRRTRRRSIAAGAAGLLAVGLLAQGAASQVAEAPPTWYAQVLARGPGGINVTNFWSKGAKLRAETVVGGRKVITIVNGDYYYAYDGLGMVGLAIHRAPAALAEDSPIRRPFGHEHEVILRQGAEKVREENLQGRPTDVYRITDRKGMREVWVTRGEPRLPVRIEIYQRSSGTRHFTDYLDWQSGLPIADAFFEPEAGIQLEKLDLDTYNKVMADDGSVGPVPVLYADLLHGKRKRFADDE